MNDAKLNIRIVRERIAGRGMKLGWIADQLNINRSTLSRFVQGHTILRGDQLLRLLKLLDLKVEDLILDAS